MTSEASDSCCVINDCYARCIEILFKPWGMLNGSVTMACTRSLSVFYDGSEQVSIRVSHSK